MEALDAEAGGVAVGKGHGLCPGGGKVCHADKAAAGAALAAVKARTGRREGRVYACAACGFWHVTSQRRGPRPGRRG